MDGAGVLEEELPTISVSALVTDSESDLNVSVVRERVKKGILFFHHFPRLKLVVLLVPLDKSKLKLASNWTSTAHSCIFSGSQKFGFTEVRTARRVTSLSTVVKNCREIGATAEIQRSQTTSKDR